MSIAEQAHRARAASRQLATTSNQSRNAALEAIARALIARRDEILAANRKDLELAEKMVAARELGAPLLKRLDLGRKFDETVAMVRSVAAQPDPLERTQTATELAEGLELYRVSVPIGVLGVIFESRPDALVQIAALCLKSGNAVLLKGGREAAHTNRVLAAVIRQASATVAEVSPDWIVLLETREDVRAILELHEDIDLIIPRGSNEFVQYIMNNTNIPVMGHADGICHVYVDREADIEQAARIVTDAKTQYVSVCNAAETLLVHRDVAAQFLPVVAAQLTARQVALRGDQRACAILGDLATPASEEDWRTEYLDYILAIRVVDDLQQAIDHVNTYGSHHTDAIVSESAEAALRFLRSVDSASVVHNASTRFADGFRYGLGAEVGISTNRLHSRGPVGLEGLTTYKYILQGTGQIVDDFEGAQPRPYSHRPLARPWRA